MDSFLFQNESELDLAKRDTQNWEWVRPTDILKSATFDDPNSPANYELKAGKYTSRKFLNAITLLSPNAHYRNLFVDCDHMEMGYVACQFYKNGEWIYVLIDTQIPYSFQRKQFLFSSLEQSNFFWLSLLEKAYAKLNGKYSNINQLGLKETIADLCNGYVSTVDLESDSKASYIESFRLFHSLLNLVGTNKGYLVGCIKK